MEVATKVRIYAPSIPAYYEVYRDFQDSVMIDYCGEMPGDDISARCPATAFSAAVAPLIAKAIQIVSSDAFAGNDSPSTIAHDRQLLRDALTECAMVLSPHVDKTAYGGLSAENVVLNKCKKVLEETKSD